MKVVKEQQQPSDARINVKSQVAQMLIDAMERGDTPWQRPWDAQQGSPMNAMNPTTGNAYKGVNRILLAIAGAGFGSNHWMTYQQAAAKGWNVRKGEKGSMIVKVVELGRDSDAGNSGGRTCVSVSGGEGNDAGADGGAGQTKNEQRLASALRRYFVFNAEQIDGMPKAEEPVPLTFDPVEKAEAVIQAMKEQTGLMFIHGGDKACYVPSLDEVRLPPKRAFKTEYDYYSTACHEVCHSTMHEKRLNRTEAYAKKWGDSAYALEELTAEIGAAILSSETGVARSPELAAAHLEDHARYLRGWIKVIQNDPMAIFTAAKNAEKISEYVLSLDKQMTAMAPHMEWIKEFERT